METDSLEQIVKTNPNKLLSMKQSRELIGLSQNHSMWKVVKEEALKIKGSGRTGVRYLIPAHKLYKIFYS